MEYISLKTALAEYHNNTHSKDEVSEDNILQWASDCLEKIGNYRQYASNIAVLPIQNYKAKLPNDFIAAELLLYQNETNCSTTTLALSEVAAQAEPNCKISCTDCCGKGIVETAAQPWLHQNFPWFGYSRVVYGSNMFTQDKFPRLRPMKLNDKSAIKYHLNDCENILKTDDNDYKDYVDYSIKDGHIITTKKDGLIILFYLGQVTDEEGYPMIPNKIEYIEAIYFYIMMKIAWADYASDKTQQARLFYSDTKALSDGSIARCVAVMNTPTWEEWKSISEMWRSRLPQVNLYGPNIDYNKARNLMLYARH